jgi:hypothetical protein
MEEKQIKTLGFCWVHTCSYWYAESGLLTKHPIDPKAELIGISASEERLECPQCETLTLTEILTKDWLTDLERLKKESWEIVSFSWPFSWAQTLYWEKHGSKHETEVCSDCLIPYDLIWDVDEEMWLCPKHI